MIRARTSRTLQIRTAEAQHVQTIASMESRFFPQHALTATQIAYYRRRGNACVLVAADIDDKILGYLIESLARRGGSTVVWIISMAIITSGRRRGAGKRLLRAALRRGKTLGASSAKLHVGVDNKPAMRLYRSSGFRVLRTVKDYYDRGKDAVLMGKRLDTAHTN